LAVVIVSFISGLDLANNMQQQFESTLERADTLNLVASKFVRKTLNSQRTKPLKEALNDKVLENDLLDLLGKNAILEIAVVEPSTNEIYADTLTNRIGEQASTYPDFRELVSNASWKEKLTVLRGNDKQFYQLETPLGSSSVTLLKVRVIIL